ncbi:MAG: hypothetical protein Q8P29_02100 [Candidatus Levybacteria bacterium]|nr:hypothetical protein [Candidatus Levybacteria bacterium]
MFDINGVKVAPNINIKLGNNKRIGILNKGHDNKFINNTFQNLDVGIQDEGKDTTAAGNKFG